MSAEKLIEMTTYMIVSADKFELPCAVFDSLKEVSQWLDISYGHAKQAVFHGYVVSRKYKIVRVL